MNQKDKMEVEFVLKGIAEQYAKMNPRDIDEIWVIRRIAKLYKEKLGMSLKDLIEMVEEALRQIEQEEKEI